MNRQKESPIKYHLEVSKLYWTEYKKLIQYPQNEYLTPKEFKYIWLFYKGFNSQEIYNYFRLNPKEFQKKVITMMVKLRNKQETGDFFLKQFKRIL